MKNNNALLNYKNSHVLERYQKDYPSNKLSAEKAFAELMKFFWLQTKFCSDKKNDKTNSALEFEFGMHYEMREIDDMWHTFLLFTRDYHAFCNKYVGEFIHHTPNTNPGDRKKNQLKKEFSLFTSYVCDNLGEETLKTWFADLLESTE